MNTLKIHKLFSNSVEYFVFLGFLRFKTIYSFHYSSGFFDCKYRTYGKAEFLIVDLFRYGKADVMISAVAMLQVRRDGVVNAGFDAAFF